MKLFRPVLLPSLCFVTLIIITSFSGKEHIPGVTANCSYVISITEGGNPVVTYTSDCQSTAIGQSGDELLMVLSSTDTKYSLTITVKGATEGEHIIKNEPPYGKNTTTLFLTSDRSKIPGALSFSTGTFTITRIKGKTADGDMKATARSAINKKTYTLTGNFKNMPIH